MGCGEVQPPVSPTYTEEGETDLSYTQQGAGVQVGNAGLSGVAPTYNEHGSRTAAMAGEGAVDTPYETPYTEVSPAYSGEVDTSPGYSGDSPVVTPYSSHGDPRILELNTETEEDPSYSDYYDWKWDTFLETGFDSNQSASEIFDVVAYCSVEEFWRSGGTTPNALGCFWRYNPPIPDEKPQWRKNFTVTGPTYINWRLGMCNATLGADMTCHLAINKIGEADIFLIRVDLPDSMGGFYHPSGTYFIDAPNITEYDAYGDWQLTFIMFGSSYVGAGRTGEVYLDNFKFTKKYRLQDYEECIP